MNLRFVLRGALFGLVTGIGVLGLGLWLMLRQLDPVPAPGTLPPPPAIAAPRGAPPPGPIALLEWAGYRGAAPGAVGCGFLLRVGEGAWVGVTTAHSLALGSPAHPLEKIAFSVAGREGFVASFDTLYGFPGRPRTGRDLTVDYVLLKLPGETGSPAAAAVLDPDPRGAPQPGERVWLVSGRDDGGQRILAGTVYSVRAGAVWAVMDESFDPRGMSGSPVLSQHTGQVVGMAIATAARRDRLLIGMHPVGSLVRLIQTADRFPRIADYLR